MLPMAWSGSIIHGSGELGSMADGTLVGIHGGGLTGILGGREKVYRFSGWLHGSIVDLWFGGVGA